MTLILRWRAPERPIATRWRGPEGMAEALTRDPALPIAAIVGPPGPQGPPGSGSGSGSGDVVGPATAADNKIPRFDGTTGKAIQASTVTIDDHGNILGGQVVADYAFYNTLEMGGTGIGRNGRVTTRASNGTLRTSMYGAGSAGVGGVVDLWSADNTKVFALFQTNSEAVIRRAAPHPLLFTDWDDVEYARFTADGRLLVGTASAGTGLVKVAGVIESSSGGFKFPDASVQTSAVDASLVLGMDSQLNGSGTIADKLVEGSGAGLSPSCYRSFAFANATTYTAWVRAKAAGRYRVNLFNNGAGTGFDTTFDLLRGTATGTGASITPLGNGEYLCAVTIATTGADSPNFQIRIYPEAGGHPYTGDGTSGICVQDAGICTGTGPGGTNLLSNSSLFSGGDWSKQNMTVTADAEIFGSLGAAMLFNDSAIRELQYAAPLAGLKWAALGSSITAGSYYTGTVEDLSGMVLTNLGYSGGSLGQASNAHFGSQKIYDAIASIAADADLVTIESGANDFAAALVPLGALGDTTIATYYGALYAAAVAVKAQAPNARLAFLTAYSADPGSAFSAYAADATNASGNTLAQFQQAVTDVAAYLSIPAVDVGRKAGIGMFTAAALTVDGLHPNAAGGAIYGAYIHAALVGLFETGSHDGGASAAIANNAVTNAKLANVATATIKGRVTAATGDPEDLTAAQVRTLINVADGATANSADATLLARANHTGTQAAATISDFNSAADARAAAAIATHAAAADPHPAYLTAAEGNAAYQPLDTQLTDISGLSYAANALKVVRVNAGETGFELVTPSGGGGGSPGGTSGELQYNNAGAFAGAANVEVDTGNLKLVSTTDPAAPTGGLVLYSKLIAGRHLPKIIGPAGIDTLLETGFSGNAKFIVQVQSGTTAPSCIGGTLTTAATMSMQLTIASANPWQATQRKRFATAGTAGSSSGMRTAYVQWFRGNAAGFGGFFFRAQIGQNLNVNGAQCFYGLCASTAALATTAGAAGALLNSIGMGYDTTDASTGNWQLFRNDGTGAATKVDLGANAARNTTHGFDLIIYCPPGAATEIFVRAVNLHSNVVVLDTSYTTDLPAVNTGLAFKAEGNNGAVASAMNLEVAKVYIESDY